MADDQKQVLIDVVNTFLYAVNSGQFTVVKLHELCLVNYEMLRLVLGPVPNINFQSSESMYTAMEFLVNRCRWVLRYHANLPSPPPYSEYLFQSNHENKQKRI